MRPEVVVDSRVGSVAGKWLARAIEAVVADRGRCRLALSGGSTPAPVMAWLADALAPALYERLAVTWVDERHLPLPLGDDWELLPEQSNLRLAWEHWFSRVKRPPELVPMARRGTLDEAVQAYTRDFEEQLGRLDVVLLGAGPDGHIASLFPEHPALRATGVCVGITDSPKPPPERLTLTLPILEDVDHALLVATGSAKAPVLRRARAGLRSLPLGRYRPRGAWHWVLDPDAASKLPSD